MTENESKSEIVEESRRFVRENSGYLIQEGVGTYTSPRISSEFMDCSMPLTFDHYSYCSMGCLYCVLAGTGIATPKRKKRVEDISVGDAVYSYNLETNLVEEDKVLSTMERTVDELLEIELDNGTTVRLTKEHPVFVNGKGWVEAGRLSDGDDILQIKRPDMSLRLRKENCNMKIKSIRKITGKYRVYNIETEKNNNYLANGVLVHNCFAYFFKSNNPAMHGVTLKPVNTKSIISAIEGKPVDARGRLIHEHFYRRKFLLHWGGLADPFCFFERNNGVGYDLLSALGENNYPTLFSFKGNTIFDDRYLKLFQKYSKQKNFAFQVSIVTGDDELAKQVEVGVPAPSKRIEALKVLSDMGYFTILRLRPFIIGVTDQSLDDLLRRCLDAGIKGVSTEFFALDSRSNVGMKVRYKWLGELMGVHDLQAYFSDLSPPERGGYMRLNRLVKEPFIKKIYRFCAEHGLVFGCSDPDFKELCTSGSCCAMPDDFPDNRLLENWSRAQLTYHLKEARRAYHRRGEVRELTFDSVYRYEEMSFLDNIDFTNDHVSVTGMCNALRYQNTYRLIALKHWNNLRSYANPRNYFHGRILPVGLDGQGNLVYKYNPMRYEERWAKDGVDLTF